MDIICERDGWVDSIFLDLKKAFDKVPHRKSIRKIESKGKLLVWMKDFLTGRAMRVTIRDKESTWKEVTSGVLLGSVLAPVMFALYINDMDEGVDSYEFFAGYVKLLQKIGLNGTGRILYQNFDRLRME